jgi:transposase
MRNNKLKIKRAIELLKNGISIRKTAQYLELSPSTIQRWKKQLKVNIKP